MFFAPLLLKTNGVPEGYTIEYNTFDSVIVLNDKRTHGGGGDTLSDGGWHLSGAYNHSASLSRVLIDDNYKRYIYFEDAAYYSPVSYSGISQLAETRLTLSCSNGDTIFCQRLLNAPAMSDILYVYSYISGSNTLLGTINLGLWSERDYITTGVKYGFKYIEESDTYIFELNGTVQPSITIPLKNFVGVSAYIYAEGLYGGNMPFIGGFYNEGVMTL